MTEGSSKPAQPISQAWPSPAAPPIPKVARPEPELAVPQQLAFTRPAPDTGQGGTAALSQVLGLTPLAVAESSAARRAGPPVEAAAELVPAEFVEDDEDDELTDEDLAIHLDLSRRTDRHSLMLAQHEVAIELPPRIVPAFRRHRSRPSRRPWLLAALAFAVLSSVAAVALLFSSRFAARDEADAATLTHSAALLPLSSARPGAEGLYVLLTQVHHYGSDESSALAQLIDEDAAAMAKAVTAPCAPGSLGCQLSEQARQILQQKPLDRRAPAPAPAEWLSGLERPRIGVQEDARVGNQLEFHGKNPVGRDIFQGLLFQCAPFQEQFQEALAQRGLPLDLLAVVMVESGCAPDAESLAGARGLWQLTLARAHAYRLEAKAGLIDERLSVAKSTDAALELLSDLYHKLGSWELALAGYQLGPFSVLAHMQQAGPNVDYSDLANSARLPPETVLYVAKVQAFAVILANLERFRFQAAPAKADSSSTALLVPAGTRLGLVARAVGSSASRIHELNPELIAQTVPGAPSEQFSLQVPADADPRAHDLLERLIADADGVDECVPLNFDWGRQKPTRAMLSRCKR